MMAERIRMQTLQHKGQRLGTSLYEQMYSQFCFVNPN